MATRRPSRRPTHDGPDPCRRCRCSRPGVPVTQEGRSGWVAGMGRVVGAHTGLEPSDGRNVASVADPYGRSCSPRSPALRRWTARPRRSGHAGRPGRRPGWAWSPTVGCGCWNRWRPPSGLAAAAVMAAEAAAASRCGRSAVKACLLDRCRPGIRPPATARVRAAICGRRRWSRPAVTPDAAADAGRDRAAATWSRLLDGVTGHVTLALPGGGATALGAEARMAAPFGGDLIRGPDDWRPLAQLPGERGAILGVADLRTAAPDAREILVYAARVHARSRAGPVGLAPCGGLERLPRAVAKADRSRGGRAGDAATRGAGAPRGPAIDARSRRWVDGSRGRAPAAAPRRLTGRPASKRRIRRPVLVAVLSTARR